MKTTLLIQDESISGEIENQIELEINSSNITIQELIKERVYQEVEAYNKRTTQLFQGLIQPTHSEKVLNGYKLNANTNKKIDPEKQYYTALDAFQQNAFFVLVNNEQVTELDAIIELKKENTVSFLKLTPLVGG